MKKDSSDKTVSYLGRGDPGAGLFPNESCSKNFSQLQISIVGIWQSNNSNNMLSLVFSANNLSHSCSTLAMTDEILCHF